MNALKPRKRQSHVCMRCGAQDVRLEYHSDVVDFKGLTLAVEGLVSSACANCGYTWTTTGQEQDNLRVLKDAFADKRDETRDREGLLTGDQIECLLAELQLSRTDASTLFGGGPNAFGKYISGDVLQSYPMDRLLRLTLAFGEHAIRYLRQGKNAPLRLGAGGYFVAPAVGSGVTVRMTADATVGQVWIARTSQTPTDYLLQTSSL